jgi:signal transduction histidine kinase
MPAVNWQRFWRYARGLAVPVVLWILVIVTLREPLRTWLRGETSYDEAALQEWLEESRGFRDTLPELVARYLKEARDLIDLQERDEPGQMARVFQARAEVTGWRDKIAEHLRDLGIVPTKMYSAQLPLFPIIFRLEVRFDPDALPPHRIPAGTLQPDSPIIWESGLPFHSSQFQEKEYRIHPSARVYVRFQLHAFNKRQRIEQEQTTRLRQMGALAVAATLVAVVWMVLVQRRERERERQRLLAQQQMDQAERLLLEQERRHEETERKLLEQRLATQAAEQKALELKSQLYASIGIMAGSYAHNIKNLLVRPNDLLSRCLEADSLSADQETMLHEVRHTLGTVTERLQQILRTVRRDPSKSEQTRLDLNEVVRDLHQTWKDLARDKWKLELAPELAPEPLPIAGDLSHLQQAVENLLFNARDATFEMRNHLRDEARRAAATDPTARRQALIAAAGWKGRVVLRTRRQGDQIILEVSDNGAGMTEEVRRRCTETHFSTKRDNALYEGHSTGMGLGLSFVVTILEHHRAGLEIASTPLEGTTFRIRFPAVAEVTQTSPAEASRGRQPPEDSLPPPADAPASPRH